MKATSALIGLGWSVFAAAQAFVPSPKPDKVVSSKLLHKAEISYKEVT